MIQNYLTAALRSFLRNGGITTLNLIGLSVGLASVSTLVLYIILESSFNSHLTNAERIFQISLNIENAGNTQKLAWSDSRLPTYLNEIPEVELSTYLIPSSQNVTAAANSKIFDESQFFTTNNAFFDIFEQNYVYGSRANINLSTNSIVITERTSRKYFGPSDPIGHEITINTKPYTIQAVVTNQPYQTDIRFEALMVSDNIQSDWCFTYFRARRDADPSTVESKIRSLFEQKVRPVLQQSNSDGSYVVESILRTHLSEPRLYDAPKNSVTNLFLLSTIGLLILGVTIVNYTNFALTISSHRFKEVGMRKLFGATTSMIRIQFASEAALLVTCSVILGALFLGLSLDRIGQLIGLDFTTISFSSLLLILPALLFVLLLSVLLSTYPAHYLSRMELVSVLKGTSPPVGGINIRNALILFQLTISMGLVGWSVMASSQLNLVVERTPWIEKNNVITIDFPPNESSGSALAFRNSASTLSAVNSITLIGANSLPTSDFRSEVYQMEKFGRTSDEIINNIFIDENYIPTLGIQILQGRNFSAEDLSSNSKSILVNEAFRTQYFSGNPIDQKLGFRGDEIRIIGVVNNFNNRGLNEKVKPLVIHPLTESVHQVLVKLNPQSTDGPRQIEKLWTTIFRSVTFSYGFLTEKYATLLRQERVTQNLMKVSMIVSVILSFLGVFGVISLDLHKQVKQLAIRRVHGAAFFDLFRLTARSYLVIVLIGGALMAPALGLSVMAWLDRFSTQIALAPHYFILPIACALVMVTVVVMYNLTKVSKATFYENLRDS